MHPDIGRIQKLCVKYKSNVGYYVGSGEKFTLILTLSETGSGTYVVKQGGANLPRMTFGFENYQNCPQM